MSQALTVYIRAVLSEGKSSSSASSDLPQPDTSKGGKGTDSKPSSESEKKTDVADYSGFNVLDTIVDDLEKAIQIAEYLKIDDLVLGFKNEKNTYNPAGSGWVIFGLTAYDPVGAMLGELANQEIVRKLQEEYKAGGHGFVLFVDKSGDSIRYEFGPASDSECSEIPIDTTVDRIIKNLEKNPDALDNVLALIGTTVGATISAGLWSGLSATVSKKAIKMFPDRIKLSLLETGIPVLLKSDYGQQFLKFAHVSVPGQTWGPERGPQYKMLSGFSFFDILKKASQEKKKMYADDGITSINCYETPDFLVADLVAPAEKQVARVKIRKALFDVVDLVPGKLKDQSLTIGAVNDDVIAVLGSPSPSLDPGISYCRSISQMACDVPYSLPAPGVPLPELTDSLNCGLFAANAFNLASPSFKFNLNVSDDSFASPVAFVQQQWSVAPIKLSAAG